MSPYRFNIELESVSADVITENNLKKVYSFLEKDLMLILKTVSLIWVLRLRFLQKNIRKAIK